MSVHDLVELGKSRHGEYVNAKPFPSGYFDDLFNPEMLRTIISEFPEIGKAKEDIKYMDTIYDNVVEVKEKLRSDVEPDAIRNTEDVLSKIEANS